MIFSKFLGRHDGAEENTEGAGRPWQGTTISSFFHQNFTFFLKKKIHQNFTFFH